MATIQKKSFWQQYGGLILILGGIAIGALIGAFADHRRGRRGPERRRAAGQFPDCVRFLRPVG